MRADTLSWNENGMSMQVMTCNCHAETALNTVFDRCAQSSLSTIPGQLQHEANDVEEQIENIEIQRQSQ